MELEVKLRRSKDTYAIQLVMKVTLWEADKRSNKVARNSSCKDWIVVVRHFIHNGITINGFFNQCWAETVYINKWIFLLFIVLHVSLISCTCVCVRVCAWVNACIILKCPKTYKHALIHFRHLTKVLTLWLSNRSTKHILGQQMYALQSQKQRYISAVEGCSSAV